jgi:Tol biopolymer transport system component
VSSDGRWIAYSSDESGEFEVYVQSVPELGRKVRVSPDGGTKPFWREDGRELFYIRPEDGALMAAKVSPGDSGLTISTPQKLFQAPELEYMASGRKQYAVLDNGERFIFNEVADVPVSRTIHVIRNWQSLVEER